MRTDLKARHLSLLFVSTMAAATCMRTSTVPITGYVVDARNNKITNVQVCALNNDCATTDANGVYTLHYKGSVGDKTVLSFSVAGFPKQWAPFTVAISNPFPTIMRAIGSVTQVSLPQTGQPAVNANMTLNGNTMVLTIEAGQLVDQNGVTATGNANINLTYWHPLELLTSTPAPMLAEDPNGGALPVTLWTWGMADIEVQQGNQLLKVAPGQTLLWTVPVPPTMQHLAQGPNAIAPNLYSVNPNNGFWHLEGSLASGAITYDANVKVWNARLPHLSPWNIDNADDPANGGCVMGNAFAKDGTPAANTDITIWFMGSEETKDWHTTTDASGHYCMATPVNNSPVSTSDQYVHYFVSGADSYTDTDMCPPASDASCYSCISQLEHATAAYVWCTDCRYNDPAFLGIDGPDGYNPNGANAFTIYNDACNPTSPIATLNAGTFCPTGCAQLQNVTLSPNGATGGTTDPCAGKPDMTGAACDPAGKAPTCCPATLVCSDYLCVPPTD